ncbi:MAG TPA: hypothetical protein VFZ49_06880 [Pyrinomonadaceae bacterium]
MKNSFAVAALVVLLIVGLGCSSINPFSESAPPTTKEETLSDKAVDTAVGKSKIGVPECDEVMDLIDAEMNNADDNFVTKAVKATVLNRIKDGIRESVEQNKTDTTELAKTCREFKMQFEKFKAEQQQKEQQEGK